VALVVALGYACLDYRFWVARFPPMHARTPVSVFREALGGSAAVAAVAVARLRGRAVFLGRCGDDDAGRRVASALGAEGVDTRGLRVLPGARTPVSGVLIGPSGERHIFPYPGEGFSDEAGWLPLEALEGAQAVMIDARWPEGAIRLAEAARRRRLPVVLDLDRETSDAWRLAEWATHVIADRELAEVSGGVDAVLGRLADLHAWGAVTLGEEGVAHRGGRVPAFAVSAQDTTGAGDVFHGAFALGLGEGMDEASALTFASAAAAQRCALAEVPRREEVVRLLGAGG
jgi:sulfofructose kinase